jgi:EAL domain-containing protein (putative c-di-GMP-specific phosphodiesterase class I)/ActR/RegA family two-component response regulator
MNRRISTPNPSHDRAAVVESATLPCAQATVLVVDDDELVAEAHRKVLSRAGFGTVAVTSAPTALELLRRGDVFDAIVTDIMMPDMDGVTLLREIRKHNLDVPIVLLTGNPSLDTAISAMHYGGFRYLTKPIDTEELARTVGDAVALHRLARLKREALTLLASHQQQLGDRASLEVHFERALDQLWMAYQPIVDWRNQSLFGYEALVRSREPTLGNPALLFDAAERLGRVWDLGRKIRADVASRMRDIPDGLLTFVNLHALDLGDTNLDDPFADLSQHAHRIVLEVTERSSLDEICDVAGCMKKLRRLGYRIAVDDLGAGYAGLSCFSRLEPDIAKLDMSLIRGIDASARMQSLVRSILSVCNRELGIQVVCEGVETELERDTLESLGADLLQGYLFGRPDRTLVDVRLAARAL